jgi:hypothetical protein
MSSELALESLRIVLVFFESENGALTFQLLTHYSANSRFKYANIVIVAAVEKELRTMKNT